MATKQSLVTYTGMPDLQALRCHIAILLIKADNTAQAITAADDLITTPHSTTPAD